MHTKIFIVVHVVNVHIKKSPNVFIVKTQIFLVLSECGRKPQIYIYFIVFAIFIENTCMLLHYVHTVEPVCHVGTLLHLCVGFLRLSCQGLIN